MIEWSNLWPGLMPSLLGFFGVLVAVDLVLAFLHDSANEGAPDND